MTKLPIMDGILRYLEENNAPFSMPGHKNGRGFLATEEGTRFYNHMIKGDMTEVEGLDNLHKPEGIIKEAEDLLKRFYGSKKSYFLVNGSTSGNLAMIFSAFNEGDKIIVERNCHRSIFNAIIMRKLHPVYINNVISEKYNAPFSIDMEHFFKLLDENKDAKGVMITYPNYYGVCGDLEAIIKSAKEKGMLILVDSAHGAHFGISELLPKSALKLGADIVVMSAHKTLPSLTQTAYLHVNNESLFKKVDFYVSSFMSTSPSYIFLATLDYARYFLEVYGKKAFEDCISLGDAYRERINNIKGFQILSMEDLAAELGNYNINLDRSRFIINVGPKNSGHELLNYLRCEGVQAEMSDQNNVVLIFSPFNTEADFQKLYNALLRCPLEKLRSEYVNIKINHIPESVLLPYEILDRDYEDIRVEDAVNRVSTLSIVPYPPGVPILMPGEKVDEEVLNMIQYCIRNKITVMGLNNGKIQVVK